MTLHQQFAHRPTDPRLDTIIKLGVFAVGGQGGGVLTNWIEEVARQNGYACQATSVAGVAQRTGSTIYYVEMAPVAGGIPVFSLAPAAGDVDILIAAEMMEAGRAIMRGFVTPDRTTLIASTHRALAVSEKMTPGDGIANSEEVLAASEIAARQAVMFDMEAMAVANGSVISASLFGALAGSGALPFPREAFEAAIRASGKGVQASLRAFSAAFDAAASGAPVGGEAKPGVAMATADLPRGPGRAVSHWQRLAQRVAAMPPEVAELARPGLRKVVEFQDAAYGEEYLARLEGVLKLDSPSRHHALAAQAAKYIANAMAYDDVIRVAGLKVKASRFARIRKEMGVKETNLLQVTEFMHPRAEEIAGMLPARIGARVQADPKWMDRLDRWFSRGRRVRTDSLGAFLMLYVLDGMRGYRRRTRRHAEEVEHLERWLSTAIGYVGTDYDLAVETVMTRRLVKGYSDTHSRGLAKFDRVMAGILLVAGRPDAADWARRMREAALVDEDGKALDGALATIRSFI